MALIVDPDLLADSAADDSSTEVYIDTTGKTIKLNVAVGDLTTDGVTLKCLYSFLKIQWRDDPLTKNLAAFEFPMVPITDESFEFQGGWDLLNDGARYLIRNAGWTVKDTGGLTIAKWAGIIGLGSIESNDQLYFDQGAGATNVQLLGQVNQAVQILDDPNGDGNFVDGFDRRTSFSLFAREYAQLYGKANLTQIGVTSMDSIAYRFPISTGTDLKVSTIDATVGGANDPYQHINIKYFPAAFSRDVDSTTDRNFGIVIDVGTHSGVDGAGTGGTSTLTTAAAGITGATYAGGTITIHEGVNAGTYPISGTPAAGSVVFTGMTWTGGQSNLSFTLQRATPVVATAEEIYEKVQWSLRQASDIDATSGSVTGKTADELLTFVGSDLKCGLSAPTNPNGGGSGVIIEGFSSTDTNRIAFYDNIAVPRTYPYVAALTINFGDNLKNDGSAKYWVYFTTLPGAGNDFGESGALVVNDNASAPMSGSVGGASSVIKSFNYDGNNQGGRTPGTDAAITVVGIGLATGQYVKATATIEQSTSNSVSLVAPLERNYANP